MKKSRVLLSALVAVASVSILGVSTANASTSKVNDYISSQGIKPVGVTKSIWSGFPKNAYRKGTGKPEGVVVHETANASSTIYNEIAYMKKNYNNAFVHSFVDASHVINIANTNYLAWGVGYPGNARFVQFEQVEVHSKSAFAKEISNAANYTATLLKQYNLKPNDAAYDGKGTVWSHSSVSKNLGGSSHTDPVGYYSTTGKKYFGQAYTMTQFYTLVKAYYNSGSSSTTASSSATSAATPLDKVSYYSGDGNENAKLSSSYKSYKLYNHVKGANANQSTYSWSSVSAKTGKKVYLDMRGVKAKSNTTWYRVRFSKSSTAKKYWVYKSALTFLNVSYKDATGTKTVKSNSTYATHNHVYNSSYLSKEIGSTKDLQGQTLTINQQGDKTDPDGTISTYYRATVNGKSVWIYSGAFE